MCLKFNKKWVDWVWHKGCRCRFQEPQAIDYISAWVLCIIVINIIFPPFIVKSLFSEKWYFSIFSTVHKTIRGWVDSYSRSANLVNTFCDNVCVHVYIVSSCVINRTLADNETAACKEFHCNKNYIGLNVTYLLCVMCINNAMLKIVFKCSKYVGSSSPD